MTANIERGMRKVVYLTRNGLLEPLGQSQVLAYLQGLSQSYTITLITYEKSEDWFDQDRMEQMRHQCQKLNITWMPQQFLRWPPIAAPVLSMIRMVWLLWCETRKQRVSLIHARSYIPAAAALAINKLTGVPFIFDMRALWPEELIMAGRIRRGSLIQRTLTILERSCLQHAEGIVSLTHAAASYLRERYCDELKGKNITVIPTCADLHRFTPARPREDGLVVHGCMGTILSGWFRIDWLARWIAVTAIRQPNAIFDIVTKDNIGEVVRALDPDARLGQRLRVRSCDIQEMPEAVRGHSLSVMFFSEGLGKLGSSPTRMAEVLGCGLPVVANNGVGDVAAIIRRNRVGVLVEGSDISHITTALDELLLLMADKDLAKRCRTTAEELFALDQGTEAYSMIYSSIIQQRTT